MPRVAWLEMRGDMLQLTDQESSLVGFGDCFTHYHSSDRQATHYLLGQMQQIEAVTERTAPYTATSKDDIILVSAGGTITLPLAKNGGEFQVIMTSATAVTVAFSGTDLLYGAGSITMTSLGSSLRFKAITGGWVILASFLVDSL